MQDIVKVFIPIVAVIVFQLVKAQEQTAVVVSATSCGQSKGCRRSPSGCQGSADCSYIYTQQVVDAVTIEIELAARASGWVAVGYSTDRRMGTDDVFGCQADSSGTVHAKNLFNIAYTNVLDDPNNSGIGLFNVSTSLVNGVIACRFSRSINGSGGNRDFNLHAPHTLFFGTHPTATAPRTSPLTTRHSGNPAISASTVTARSTFDIGSATSSSFGLLKAHGIMMVYSWVALSVNGMFYARFLRPLYKKYWFHIHWITMLITLALLLSAAICIGVYVGSFRATAHAGLGITVLVLAGLQPIIALFRPDPEAENRALFVWVHRAIAALCQVLGWVSLGLGLNEANKVLEIGDTPVIVFSCGAGAIAVFWLYMEYRKRKADGGGEATEDTTPCYVYKRLSWAFLAVSYGFTIGTGSLIWGSDPR